MTAAASFRGLPRWIRGAQIVIGVLMLWAALAKLGDLSTFSQQVHNFRMLPVALENLVAMTLPWIEILAGLSLVLGVHARSGAFVTTVLLTIFTIGVLQAVVRGLDFECGCFGTADASRVGLGKAFQNVAMLAVSLLASLRSDSGTEKAASTVPSAARTISSES